MKPEQACQEMSDELEDAARWLTAGGLSLRQFRMLLDIVGRRKLNGSGLKLHGFVSGDGGVHFTLRSGACDALCRVMDVDPQTGKLTSRPPAL